MSLCRQTIKFSFIIVEVVGRMSFYVPQMKPETRKPVHFPFRNDDEESMKVRRVVERFTFKYEFSVSKKT